MQGVFAGHFGRDCLPQFGQAQVVRVERFATLQRFNGRLADEVGRDFIAFAKPEREHVVAAQSGIGNVADFGFFKIQDGVAHRWSYFD